MNIEIQKDVEPEVILGVENLEVITTTIGSSEAIIS